MKRHSIKSWFKQIFKATLLAIYKCTYGFYINKRFNVRVTRNDMKALKGSFILLGNHVTNFDGFWFQQHASRNISFVINDKMFRSTFLRSLMLYMDMIPKKKSSNDIRAVRRIFKAKERGDIVGIFPEGRRSWDGVTAPIVKGTATLIKSAKLPVVVGLIKGAAASSPRWRNNSVFRGLVEIEYQKILSKEDVKSMSVDKILEALTEAMKYNEVEFLKRRRIIFKGRDRAEGLERLLFMCPKCLGIGSLKSRGNHIKCSCGLKVFYDEHGLLENGPFDNTAEWNAWQREQLAALAKAKGDDEAVLCDEAVELLTARGYDRFRRIMAGTARLSRKGVQIEGIESYVFSLDEIFGLNVQANDTVEFNKDDICYRLRFPARKSAYKWQALIHTYLNKQLEGNL